MKDIDSQRGSRQYWALGFVRSLGARVRPHETIGESELLWPPRRGLPRGGADTRDRGSRESEQGVLLRVPLREVARGRVLFHHSPPIWHLLYW